MLKFLVLIIGACVLAPVVLLALLISLPALPFLLGALLILKMVSPRRLRFGRPSMRDRGAINVSVSRRSIPTAPIILTTLAVAMALQIRFGGFSWPVEFWLGSAMLVVAGLWWLQYRIGKWWHRRSGSASSERIGQHDLYRLLEIERTTEPEERRMLVVRELNRLMQAALRPDPAYRSTWPQIPELASLRDQLRVLRSSMSDPVAGARIEVSSVDLPSWQALLSGIDALEAYLNQFLRVRLISHDDLEQIRILVRDQTHLRSMQDGIVDQLQQAASVPIAG